MYAHKAMVFMSTHVMNKGKTLVLVVHVGVDALLSPSSSRSISDLLSFSSLDLSSSWPLALSTFSL